MRNWPNTPAEWNELYRNRESRAAGDQIEAFFFELDRTSEPNLMEHNPAFTPKQRVARLAAWKAISSQLEIRLESRFNGLRTTVPVDLAMITGFSNVVASAARELPARVPLGEVMLDFGSGKLERVVRIGSGAAAVDVPACAPDSYFIWFFAEFALLALEHDIDKALWDSSIKSLIEAAFLFSKRFPPRLPIQMHNNPPPLLDGRARDRARKEFAAIWKSAKQRPAEALALALRASGSCYRS